MGEREHQLGVLRSAVERARTGHGSVLLLTGESGLGKTTLLKALAAELRDVVRVLAGGCDDLGQPRRLGPLREAGVDVEGDYPSLLGRLGAEPTVLLIDDLQWADDATLDLLGYLARRVHDQPLAVVLALRDDAALPHQVRRWLGSLATAGLQRLPLAPLSFEAVRALAADEAERVYALAGGNPFYTAELLTSAGVPATVGDAVLAKVAQLTEAGRLAVEQLAVIPGTVDLELVERLVSEHRALVEAEQYGLLEARAEGIGFRYEIVRLAIEESLPGLRRRTLHQAALDAQAEDEDRYLARLAHHAIAASDTAAIAAYAPRAGAQAAAAGVRDEALRMFEAAWQRWVLPAELVGAYAWELFNAYRFTEAIELDLPEEFHYFAGVEARWDEPDAGSVPERDLLEIKACLEHLRDGRWALLEERLTRVLRRVGGPNLVQATAAAVLFRLHVRRGTAESVPPGDPALLLPALIEQAFLAGDTARVAELRDEWRSLEGRPVWAEIQRYCALAGVPTTGSVEPARGGYEQALQSAGSGEAEPMMEALRVLEELGAQPAAELVRRRLRRLGMRVVRRGPSAATRAHPVGLTSRQADVLHLVVDGLTNAEIAEKLVLSVRTIDHHVSAILARLGVSSRRQVRAALRARSAVA